VAVVASLHIDLDTEVEVVQVALEETRLLVFEVVANSYVLVIPVWEAEDWVMDLVRRSEQGCHTYHKRHCLPATERHNWNR
jgi:hypothetical protein